MKSYVLSALFALVVLLNGCQPEVFDCELHRWGTLNISNTSGHDLHIYLDDKPLAVVPVGGRASFNHVATGYHTVYAVQLNTQQGWQNYITMQTCQTVNLAFKP